MALDVKYAEDENETNTTLIAWQDKSSLVFTPDTTKNYLIIVTAEFYQNPADNNDGRVRVLIDDVEHAIARDYNDGTDFWMHFGYMIQKELDDTSHTIKVQYCTVIAGRETYIRRVRIIAIGDIPDSEIDYQSDETESGTQIESWQDKMTFNIPDGNYLIIASAQCRTDASQKRPVWRLYNNTDAIEYGIADSDFKNISIRGQRLIVTKVNLTSTKQFKIQWYRQGITFGTVYIKNVHVIMLNLRNFTYYYDADEGQDECTTEWQTKVTQNFTPPKSDDYLTIYCFQLMYTTAEAEGRKNGVGEAIHMVNMPWQFSADIRKNTLPASAQTFDIRYRKTSGASRYIKYARIINLKLDYQVSGMMDGLVCIT